MDDPAHNPAAPPATHAPADADPGALGPGATLGDYRLGARLGGTAAADAYDATHVPSGTPRVVHVLRPAAMQDHPLVHRVVCEVDAARWLRHPAAAKVDGYGDAPGGRMYVAAERAPGRPLADLLAGGTGLTPRRVVRLACRVVEALEEAHAVGLVHGRLTPGAVVLGDDVDAAGAPMVTVTGLGVAAVAFDAQPRDAERAYVSPEQQAGAAPDVRGDVYGLASVLWAALAGRAPDDGDDPAAADTGVPGADVLRAARAPEPGRRPASVRAFWEELLGALVADAAAAAAEPAPAGPAAGSGAPAALLDPAAFDLADFDLTELALAPAPAAAGWAARPHAAPHDGLGFGALDSTPELVPAPAAPAAAPAAARLPAVHAPEYAPVVAHAAAAPPVPPFAARPAPSAPARAYRWDDDHSRPRPARPAAPPRRPRRWFNSALPWWLAVPAVAAAAVGAPLARDWAYPGPRAEPPSAGEVVAAVPAARPRPRRPLRTDDLPADTAAGDTLPAVPWVEVPVVELPAAADSARPVVRADDFWAGLGGARAPR
jgi:hypothetical protein